MVVRLVMRGEVVVTAAVVVGVVTGRVVVDSVVEGDVAAGVVVGCGPPGQVSGLCMEYFGQYFSTLYIMIGRGRWLGMRDRKGRGERKEVEVPVLVVCSFECSCIG